MAIIAINGKIHSGKDTVAKIWQGLNHDMHVESIAKAVLDNVELPVTQMAPGKRFWIKTQYAKKLKMVVALMLNVPVDRLEDGEFKDSTLPDSWQKWSCYNNERFVCQLGSEEEAQAWVDSVPLSSYYKRTFVKSQRTVRWLLQYIGTDLFRDQIHPQIHINMLFAEYVGHDELAYYTHIGGWGKNWSELYHHISCKDCGNAYSGYKRQYRCKTCIEKEPLVYPNWLIPDLRFPNEFDAAGQHKALRIRVQRPFALRFPALAHFIKPEYHNTFYGIPEEIVADSKYDKLYAKLTHESEVALDYHNFEENIFNDGDLNALIEKVREIMIKYKYL
jgi:hypothetical protein